MAYIRQGATNLYVGLSTDVLPTGVPEGSEAHTLDTDVHYKTANGTNWYSIATAEATAAEVAKIPKSDSTVSWNATALGAINAEVDTALNTIVPASPTAGSLNDALSKAAGGNTYNKATDSLEALSDKVALEASGNLAAVKTQTDKLAGATPGVGSTTANWNTATGTSGEAGEDLVTIGANDTRNKLLSLLLDVSACTDGALLTVKMFTQINGVERKVYSQTFLVATDPDGLWIVQGVVGIHEALRVEVYSNTSESVAIAYDYGLEAM